MVGSRTVRLALLLVALQVAVTLAPTGQGFLEGPRRGEVLYAFEYSTATWVLLPGGPGVFCTVDRSNATQVTEADTVLLSTACGGVPSPADVVLLRPSPGRGGAAAAAPVGPVTQPLPNASFAYYDADADAVFSSGDSFFVDTDGDGSVSVGDIMVAGSRRLDLVNATATELGSPLVPAAGALAFLDVDATGTYTGHASGLSDWLVFDQAGPGQGLLTVMDVILSGKSGTIVGPDDRPTLHPLLSGGSWAACFVDDNANAVVGPSESVYLSRGDCSTILPNDVRWANPVTGGYGSQVGGSDIDAGRAATQIPLTFAFDDRDLDGRLGSMFENVYLDADFSGTVSVGDVPVGGPRSGQVVTTAARDYNNALVPLYGSVTFDDRDGDGFFGRGDLAVLDNPQLGAGLGLMTADDLVLSAVPFSSTGPGFLVGSSRPGAALLADGAPNQLCFNDRNGNGLFGTGEAVFLSLACGNVAPGDIRVANRIGRPADDQVRFTDGDVGKATVPLDAPLGYVDAEADGTFSGLGHDTLYADLDADGTVSLGDLMLSGILAGTFVQAKDANLGQTLVPAAGTFRFVDATGSGTYALGDAVVYDDPSGLGDANAGQLTAGDVAMANLAASGRPAEAVTAWFDEPNGGLVAGQAGTILLHVANRGGLATGPIAVALVLPRGDENQLPATSGGTCTAAGLKPTCTLDVLAPGQTTTVWITTPPVKPGTLMFSASAGTSGMKAAHLPNAKAALTAKVRLPVLHFDVDTEARSLTVTDAEPGLDWSTIRATLGGTSCLGTDASGAGFGVVRGGTLLSSGFVQPGDVLTLSGADGATCRLKLGFEGLGAAGSWTFHVPA